MQNLSDLLKASTRELHAEAEKNPLMRAFFKGNFDTGCYRFLLLNLRPVYQALEQALVMNRDLATIRPLIFSGLERTQRIDSDLEFYYGRDDRPTPTDASLRYSDHLRSLGSRSPYLLSAHAYVRYMGDISGGQMIAGIVRKTLKLASEQGLAFYNFESFQNGEDGLIGFKTKYRDALDSLPLSETQKEEVASEACLAFQLNIDIFDEVAKHLNLAER